MVPIGRPVANVTAHVVDRALAPVPVAVPGELLLGGAGLARGYLGRPARTAAAFVPDPWSRQPGARLYRTGDLARRLPGGDLVYLGRLDRQVKLRGFRIELGEIEARLAARPEVREAAVVVAGDEPADHRLVAFVVAASEAEDGGAGLAAALTAALAAELPAYMVPADVVAVGELPRTAGGKLDRRALAAAAPAAGGARPAAPPVPPRDEREEALAAIWREVLGVAAVGVHDNFFALGGHSLKATRVVARVRRTLGAELPLREMFERPTVAGLAAALAEAEAGPARPMATVRSALSRLEELSEDEVKALLDRKKAVLEGASS